MDYTEEQLRAMFEKLPKDVYDAATSIDVSNKLQELGEKYKLHIDKIDTLFDETTLVMLGLTHPKDYLANLKKRLEIPDDLARMIVTDVNEQIFKPIRESLKRIHNISRERNVVNDVAQNMYYAAPEINSNSGGAPSYKLQEGGGQASRPAETLPEQSLSRQDEKILADSGINLINNSQQITNKQPEISPKKEELIEALENPDKIEKETVTVPAGFTLTKTVPAGSVPVVSPDQKLSAPTRLPPTESVYEAKGVQQPTTGNQQPTIKPAPDPYREPVS